MRSPTGIGSVKARCITVGLRKVNRTGSFETDLRTFPRSTVAGAGRHGRLLAALMAEAQFDEDLAEAFRT